MASDNKNKSRVSPTSRMTDVEVSVLEMRNSLLHLMEESMGEKKNQTHRLVCISKTQPETSGSTVGDHFTNIVKEMAQPEEVTGLLLIFPMHCVHVLEGSMDTILEYLRSIRSQVKEGFFSSSKILVIAHNIATTLFQNWMYHELDIQATGIGDYESNEPTENLVIDVVVNTMKMGLHLSKQPKLGYEAAVQALHEKVPELLPQQDMLDYFLEKYDPAVQAVEDFLKYYEEPYKVTLTSETVWPMPDHLMPSFS